MINPILAVRDVDASVKFYTEKLGFQHAYNIPLPDGGTMFGWVSLGAAGIGLQVDTEVEHRGNGIVLMVSLPDEMNIDEYYAQVQAKGVEIVVPIKDEFWGDRTFMLKDPDGYMISPLKTMKQMSPEEVIAAAQTVE